MVPVRIIGTDDEGVIASIVRATNRQTEVKEDQFFALQEFPRQLEQFFQSFQEESKRLYYERRTCQYDRSGIDKSRVITEANVVRSFASMFLDEAHRTTRNYKSIREKVTKYIFAKGHKMEPYYLAAYAFYRLEMLFKKWKLEGKLKPARFHILMAARLLIGKPVPAMHSNDMSKYFESVMKTLWDDTKAETLLLQAAEIVTRIAKNTSSATISERNHSLRKSNNRFQKMAKLLLTQVTNSDAFRGEAIAATIRCVNKDRGSDTVPAFHYVN